MISVEGGLFLLVVGLIFGYIIGEIVGRENKGREMLGLKEREVKRGG